RTGAHGTVLWRTPSARPAPRRCASAASRSGTDLRASGRSPLEGAREVGARREWRVGDPPRPLSRRAPDAAGASNRARRRAGSYEQRGGRGPLLESQDDRDAPWPRLPPARRALADRARSSSLERGRAHRSPGTKPGVTLARTAPSAACRGGRHGAGDHRREIPNPAGGFARGDLRAPRPSVDAVINRPKEVTKMLSKASLRRLITT